jgi:hypothetical protein
MKEDQELADHTYQGATGGDQMPDECGTAEAERVTLEEKHGARSAS